MGSGGCLCVSKQVSKTPPSRPVEPSSLFSQPLMDGGVKAKDRKAAMPRTD